MHDKPRDPPKKLKLLKMQEHHLADLARVHKEKKQILRSIETTDKYNTNFPMPNIIPVPRGFRTNLNTVQGKEIVKTMGDRFNPNSNTTFKIIWERLIKYGQKHYFTEDEFKESLSLGSAWATQNNAKKKGHSLKVIISELLILYDISPSISDYKRDINRTD